MKKLFLPIVLLAGASLAAADTAKEYSSSELTFGWVRGTDGIKRSVKGLELRVGPVIKLDPSQVKEVKLWRNGKHSLRPRLGPPPPARSKREAPRDLFSLVAKMVGSSLHANANPFGGGGMAENVIFSNRTANFYKLANEFPDPSTLDDITLSGGAGKLWKRIWVGIDISIDREFLIRWQVFDTALSGTGPNESAFADILGPNNFVGEPAGDFGGIERPSEWPGWAGPGSYLVPFDLPAPSFLWWGITCPDNNIYLGQQFREPQTNGEGPFDSSFKHIYTADIPANTGSSQDGFWYDWNDLNGIYSADEFEFLGDINGQPVPFSNVCREIVVDGSLTTFGPISYTLTGIPVSGDGFSLQESDDDRLVFRPRWDVARTLPNATLEVQGTSPSSNLTGFRFLVETAATSAGGTIKIELWNWNTSSYELFHTGPIPGADTNIEVVVPSNYSRFVNSTNRRVKSLVSYFAPHNVIRTYAFSVDKAAWTVTTP